MGFNVARSEMATWAVRPGDLVAGTTYSLPQARRRSPDRSSGLSRTSLT